MHSVLLRVMLRQYSHGAARESVHIRCCACCEGCAAEALHAAALNVASALTRCWARCVGGAEEALNAAARNVAAALTLCCARCVGGTAEALNAAARNVASVLTRCSACVSTHMVRRVRQYSYGAAHAVWEMQLCGMLRQYSYGAARALWGVQLMH